MSIGDCDHVIEMYETGRAEDYDMYTSACSHRGRPAMPMRVGTGLRRVVSSAQRIDHRFQCGICAGDRRRCHHCQQCGQRQGRCICCPSCGTHPCQCDVGLQGHRHTPILRFRPGRGFDHAGRPLPVPGTPYLGVELEVELRGARRKAVLEATEWQHPDVWWCKRDGSLQDGVEVVSHPATLEVHRDLPWEPMLTALKETGVRSWSTDTCGLHVHVARDSMTDSQLWRFARLFDGNPVEWSQFAGRANERFAAFGAEESHRVIARKEYTENRYRAVNLVNPNTVEVRIFRGSLKPAAVFGAMEAVAAARDYATTLTYTKVQNGGLEFRTFAEWAAEHRFPNLTARIEERVSI